MRILVVGTGGVGGAFASVAARRDVFDAITLGDLDPERPRALVEQGSAASSSTSCAR